ncbi:hypothetical protein ABEB36_008420 [Hypothenemus hampei]|uniref:Rabaptin GTPase-Rab5 binding domain-containing protein n=1 Tax=Hypothenemus hampei TaxID=57062 RepID=A0ABD1ELT2_HYPHA
MDTTEDLDLLKKIEELESTNKRMMDEYNGQRAKMKDLFLQKEAELSRKTEENNSLIDEVKRLKNELDDVKSQLVVESIKEYDFEVEKRKADEEIASLQRLIHETVEESSSNRNLYDHDLKKLQSYIQQLQKKIEQLQHENNQLQAQSSEHTLAPSVVLNAFTKGIVKKFDAFGGSQDEKSGKLQEDVELLKSLVEPLNDQINALKEKLRATDEKLQKCQECGHSKNDIDNCVEQSTDNINLQNTSTNTSFDTPKVDNLTCDMCSNYEAQLVREQQTVSELKQKVQVAEKSSDRYKEELIKEIGFRKEMEEKWNEKREEHKKQVAELTQITQCTEQDLKEMKEYFNETSEEMRAELAKLQKDRDRVAIELKTLQRENENLVGKYTLHSQQLQSEIINLPNTIEELHELVLRNHQDLVIAKVGKETAQEELKTVKNEFSYHKQKYESFQTYVKSIEEKNEELREQLQKLEKEKKSMLVKNSNLQEKDDLITQLTDSMVGIQFFRFNGCIPLIFLKK